VADQTVDIFDREKVFIETVLTPLRQKLTKLKIVMEQITTEDQGCHGDGRTDTSVRPSVTSDKALVRSLSKYSSIF
jgi:dihydroorotase